MRAAVLILGILGGLAAGFLGFKWYSDYNAQREQLDMAEELIENLGVEELGEGAATLGTVSNYVNASYILMADLLIGIVGGILAFTRKPVVAGLLMVVGAAAPAIFVVDTLVFTAILGLAGLLALIGKSKIEQS